MNSANKLNRLFLFLVKKFILKKLTIYEYSYT